MTTMIDDQAKTPPMAAMRRLPRATARVTRADLHCRLQLSFGVSAGGTARGVARFIARSHPVLGDSKPFQLVYSTCEHRLFIIVDLILSLSSRKAIEWRGKTVPAVVHTCRLSVDDLGIVPKQQGLK